MCGILLYIHNSTVSTEMKTAHIQRNTHRNKHMSTLMCARCGIKSLVFAIFTPEHFQSHVNALVDEAQVVEMSGREEKGIWWPMTMKQKNRIENPTESWSVLCVCVFMCMFVCVCVCARQQMKWTEFVCNRQKAVLFDVSIFMWFVFCCFCCLLYGHIAIFCLDTFFHSLSSVLHCALDHWQSVSLHIFHYHCANAYYKINAGPF